MTCVFYAFRSELQRRNAVSKCKLYFKILYNDKKVAETCERWGLYAKYDFKMFFYLACLILILT